MKRQSFILSILTIFVLHNAFASSEGDQTASAQSNMTDDLSARAAEKVRKEEQDLAAEIAWDKENWNKDIELREELRKSGPAPFLPRFKSPKEKVHAYLYSPQFPIEMERLKLGNTAEAWAMCGTAARDLPEYSYKLCQNYLGVAIDAFKKFASAHGLPTEIEKVNREDYYKRQLKAHFMASHDENYLVQLEKSKLEAEAKAKSEAAAKVRAKAEAEAEENATYEKDKKAFLESFFIKKKIGDKVCEPNGDPAGEVEFVHGNKIEIRYFSYAKWVKFDEVGLCDRYTNSDRAHDLNRNFNHAQQLIHKLLNP